MAKQKTYEYGGYTLFVGARIWDKNGYEWVIIGCGPSRVKYTCDAIASFVEHNGFTSHCHFIENVIKAGHHTRHLPVKTVDYKTAYALLLYKAAAFINMYERSFGAPDKECTEFWELRNELRKIL
jgi:hypothetical protein